MGKRCSCCGEIARPRTSVRSTRGARKCAPQINRRDRYLPSPSKAHLPRRGGKKGSLFTEAANNLDAEVSYFFPFSFSFFSPLFSRYLSRTTVERPWNGDSAGIDFYASGLLKLITSLLYAASGLLINYVVNFFLIYQSKYLDKYQRYEGMCALPFEARALIFQQQFTQNIARRYERMNESIIRSISSSDNAYEKISEHKKKTLCDKKAKSLNASL